VWAKDPAIGNTFLNALTETLATKSAFRRSLCDRSCLIRPFHHRMPVIPVPADYDLWLDVRIHDVGRILPLLKRYPPEWVMAYALSPLIKCPANASPACQSPTGDT